MPDLADIHFRLLFEQSRTSMMIVDPNDGRILEANRQAEEYYGWSRKALLAMTVMDVQVQSRGEVLANLATAARDQRHQFFARHRKASGMERDVEMFWGPMLVDGRLLLSVIIHDITEKRQLEAHYAFLTERALMMLALPELADSLNEAEFMQRGLEIAEDLTGSQIAFIHFVNDDEETIELVTWSRRTLDAYCHATYDRHYPVSQAGIWAEALRERAPVIFNDYASAPGKRGLPEGHAVLARLISLPVVEHGKVVMLAGVGNKTTDYEDRDVETLQLLANDIWRLVQRQRSQKQVARLGHLLEQSQREIFTFDAATLRFIDANRSACRNLGYRLDELRLMTPLDIKPEMTADSLASALAPLRRRESAAVHLLTTHQRKDGSRYPAEVQIEISEEVNPVFVAIAQDISERRKAEVALRQALRVVEASPVVLFRWRAEPGWPVEYVSDNVARWGYAVADLLAGCPPFVDLVHADDLPRVAAEVERYSARGPDEYRQEYRLRHADGHYFWVDDHTRITRDAAGKVRCYEGVLSDIDVKKTYENELAGNLRRQRDLNHKLEQAQNQLLQSEKMASIGQLAAGVAHELNNPIGFVTSNLGTLEDYLRDIFEVAAACEAAVQATARPADLAAIDALKSGKDFDYIRQDIFQLMAESRDGLARVAKIVKDLKDFSRAGEAEWQLADLHAGLDSTLNIVWNELKYKCSVTKDYGPLPPVWCVPSQLNQVFMNLLVNAGHAIQDKGEITLRTGVKDDQVFVAVSDTGVGIAPEHLNRIFEPFFTTKPVGKGTGLGLSLAWSIVRKHHGRIDVLSTPNAGTTMTVWLPVAPVDDDDAVPPGLTFTPDRS